MTPYRSSPGVCPACGQQVPDRARHYAVGPQTCPALAAALPTRAEARRQSSRQSGNAGRAGADSYLRANARPCARCHAAPRLAYCAYCKTCHNKANRENYRQTHGVRFDKASKQE